MSSARLRWLTSITVGIMLVTAGSVAHAQDTPDDPAALGDAFCALFSPGEIRDVVDTEVAAEPSFGGCTWTATTSGESVSAAWTETSLADQKAAWPSGSDTSIGGRTAYYSPGLFLNELLIELDPGVLWLNISGFDGDVEAALTELGEMAVSRSASLPPPPGPEPEPSLDADLALEALFPESIGGEAIDVLSVAGEDVIFDVEARPAISESLATLGKTFDDLTGAFVFSAAGSIAAFRIAGGDGSALLPLIVGQMAGDGVEMTPAQVAGKDVTLVGADTPYYAYAAGDVLWLVQADEPALTEIITALP